MKQEKVLHIIDSSGLYGAERVILTLLDELQGSAFQGILGCFREADSEIPQIAVEAQDRGIAVELFTTRRGFTIDGIQQISRFVSKNNIRLIHSHGYKPNIFLSLLPCRKVKILSTAHGWEKNTAGLRARAYELLDALSLRSMDKVVAVSKAVFNDLTRHGLREENITLIYNGIVLDEYEIQSQGPNLRKEYGIPQDTFVIGAIGRLVPAKGYHHLIEAMTSVAEDIKDCRLLIAGEGQLKDNLSALIQKLNISRYVTLVGYQNSITRFLSTIDLFVMPSLTEGLPIALLEAMACGKPVLASSIGGIPEVITSEKDGLLIPPADPHAIAKGIKELYFNETLRVEMSCHGRKLVENIFSAETMGRQYLSLYSQLLS